MLRPVAGASNGRPRFHGGDMTSFKHRKRRKNARDSQRKKKAKAKAKRKAPAKRGR
jgi:hypothetical protein